MPKKGFVDGEKSVSGFSKLSKRGKIKWLVENFFKNPEQVARELMSYWHPNDSKQKVFDEISENTISNFILPFGVAPNFFINDKKYVVPMVIEESSVVAAASAGAKYWLKRGGFTAKVIDTVKVGQVHFYWDGNPEHLKAAFPNMKQDFLSGTQKLTESMQKRGGGILDLELLDFTDRENDYYQLRITFETCDSMGANFINSVLEAISKLLVKTKHIEGAPPEVIMSILSNYTPDCLVQVEVSCPVADLGQFQEGMTPEKFAERFRRAVRIAEVDPYRATTHNKGIYNGVDAVALATANDFRAIEACGHTYASRSGQYSSLSYCKIENDTFLFGLKLPVAIGTVGGLTAIHPLAKRSLEMLGNPTAKELMCIMASVGLAQNFAAVRSLVTTGIQKGHMKMHLVNILNHMEATEIEAREAITYFKDKVVSFSAVREFLDLIRNGSSETALDNS